MNDYMNRTNDAAVGTAAAESQHSASSAGSRRAPAGPPLPPLAIVVVALSMASIVLPTVIAGGATYPSPFGDGDAIVAYFREHELSVLITALLQFAASIPLVIFAAAATTRLTQLGVRAPGVSIGFAGGILASVSMAMSAGFSWALTRPELLEEPGIVRLLHDLAFFTGGPGFVVPLGLLIAGLAVPGLLAGLLPRWHAWAGLVLAGLAMVATLVVAIPELAVLLPIVRFPSFAWIVLCAFLLPLRRTDVARPVRTRSGASAESRS
ncbi:hypothetical protein SAMN05443544_2448 [Agromyces cerinus subsp. cerinus]|uniref:DUF4386 domain-containing protein n=2 Tax=Agromyces cerinus TaxID=33878 RepID=A0A1N6GBW3_9MICO|nr:hypothetical protein SAMN05443544_2448 [Agromyces cerinus subsp. cerinus]